jgi:hypothetical protein
MRAGTDEFTIPIRHECPRSPDQMSDLRTQLAVGIPTLSDGLDTEESHTDITVGRPCQRAVERLQRPHVQDCVTHRWQSDAALT